MSENKMGVSVLEFLNSNPVELGPFAGNGSKESRWRHWRMSEAVDGVVWLLLDRQNASVNSLSEEVLAELDDILSEMEKNRPKLVVLRSAKKSGFCAGADIAMFRGAKEKSDVLSRLENAHRVIDRLTQLPAKKVAVIHGLCLGGGLELALACDIRIAVKGASLGFPEVMLGLHPGLGGTYRCTALINPLEAMTMMLTGKTQRAEKAKQLGLVDAVTEERHVANAVSAAADGNIRQRRRPFYFTLFEISPVRRLLARQMVEKTESKASQDHYPAPFSLIELWKNYGGNPRAMQREEQRSFASLVVEPGAQNLIRVFYLREGLKNLHTRSEQDIRHIHVVGAGTMGGDIAAWCALKGFKVTLADMQVEMIGKAVECATGLCARKRMNGADTRDTLDRLIPDPTGGGARHADLLIEAVPEKIEIKKTVYDSLQKVMKPEAILATNTSSIPLETLRESVEDPSRFVGLHFFNPVAQMQLVEVVTHDGVSENTIEIGNAFVKAIERLPVPVKSAPGFLVNRVLTPYLLEAMLMLDEGVKAEAIDRAAVEFGMPMGPIELADQVGLDICLDVGDTLRDQLDVEIPAVPSWIRDKVRKDETGKKSGKGFYTWDGGKPQKSDSEKPPKGAADRLILPLLNACASCLRQKIVRDSDTLDGAVIFGTGFAPFRGGPMHYAKSRGVDEVIKALEEMESLHGERFQPDAGWSDL